MPAPELLRAAVSVMEEAVDSILEASISLFSFYLVDLFLTSFWSTLIIAKNSDRNSKKIGHYKVVSDATLNNEVKQKPALTSEKRKIPCFSSVEFLTTF